YMLPEVIIWTRRRPRRATLFPYTTLFRSRRLCAASPKAASRARAVPAAQPAPKIIVNATTKTYSLQKGSRSRDIKGGPAFRQRWDRRRRPSRGAQTDREYAFARRL